MGGWLSSHSPTGSVVDIASQARQPARPGINFLVIILFFLNSLLVMLQYTMHTIHNNPRAVRLAVDLRLQ